ncbi:Gamma interferon responsive lysosomal thiol reductase family protein, putative [Theobroma cacao]|uniref:Gamma interferon responsive lysosomal thiol reductase family protein, putative n=1 Tax=Theobroma cacao TaxID=3641 RepID=A0A061ERV6_THECC|nr:Gamma interferon responsive lysosomal thiol reductase family protein, putative [Theobroma cacao]
MASPRFFFAFFLSTSMLFLLSISPCHAQNVTLSLYYETLCPYCADFIVNHLVKLFDKGLNSIVNLRLVPWGNAVMQRDGNFVCQHGPDECVLNAIDACTITIYPEVERHFRFILCVERLALENKVNEWVNCFDMTGLGRVPVDCYKSGYGNMLEKHYAAETAQLNPPHKFVPWVLVNGQPLEEDFKSFVSYVCKAYQGKLVPEACHQSLPLMNNSLKKASLLNADTPFSITLLLIFGIHFWLLSALIEQ